ncbi:hypothetical protein STAL104432_31060 [Streptomyces albus]
MGKAHTGQRHAREMVGLARDLPQTGRVGQLRPVVCGKFVRDAENVECFEGGEGGNSPEGFGAFGKKQRRQLFQARCPRHSRPARALAEGEPLKTAQCFDALQMRQRVHIPQVQLCERQLSQRSQIPDRAFADGELLQLREMPYEIEPVERGVECQIQQPQRPARAVGRDDVVGGERAPHAQGRPPGQPAQPGEMLPCTGRHLDVLPVGKNSDDLSRVGVGVEPVPVAGQLLEDACRGVVPELLQQHQRRVRPHLGRRVGHGHSLVHVQVVHIGQQLQHHPAQRHQRLGLIDAPRRNQLSRPLLHLRPHRGVQFRGVLQAGRRQQVQPAAALLLRIAPAHEPPQQLCSLVGAGVGDGHPDDVLPLVEVGVLHQDAEVALLHGGLGAQIVLEGAVDEVDRTVAGLAQQPGPHQQEVEDLFRRALFGDVRHRGEHPLYHSDRVVLRHFGATVADEPVGELLQQLDLGLLVQFDGALTGVHGALPVATFQEHRQCRVVQGLAPAREEAVPFPVQGADEAAHQRVGGEARKIRLRPYGCAE